MLKALKGHLCADDIVLLRNYSLTHSLDLDKLS